MTALNHTILERGITTVLGISCLCHLLLLYRGAAVVEPGLPHSQSVHLKLCNFIHGHIYLAQRWTSDPKPRVHNLGLFIRTFERQGRSLFSNGL